MMVPLGLVRLTVVLGHWKLPPKLIWSTARWRARHLPQVLVLLEALKGLMRSRMVIGQVMAPRV